MKKVQTILPHIVFITALFLTALWVLDQLNPLMGFLSNPLSDLILLLFFLVSALNGICDIHKLIQAEQHSIAQTNITIPLQTKEDER